MPRRGRPKRERAPKIYNVKLVLYAGQDDDLIAYLDAAPDRKRAAAVKTAMRGGNLVAAAHEGLPDDDELLDAFEDLLI